MQIAGYEHLQLCCEGSRTNIYSAERQQDGRPVILKCLRGPYPSAQEVARFRREYEITRLLAGEGVIECLDFIQADGDFALVLEDFGGTDLRPVLGSGGLEPIAALDLMLQLVPALGRVHAAQVVHRDINPSNLVWHRPSQTLKLIDFGIASRLSRQLSGLSPIETIEGTLAYLAPEQTGRINRPVDYRADFYALGVTFYALLTGQLPFDSTAPLELVHAHIARQPLPPHVLNAAVPEPVSAIALKLMAKAADDRYQSSYGLLQDLQRCRQALAQAGQVPPFDLAQQDLCDRLSLPQQLYGRSADSARLLAAFERCCQGAVEVVMVAGYSGIGKTALVNEVHRPVTQAGAEFIAGKFDQFNRSLPYGPLVSALGQAVQQRLGRGEAAIAACRQALEASLGSNAALLLQLIPELKQLLPPQPDPGELPAAEAETRLQVLFRRLLRVLATAEQPLVLFTDDLQWADAAFVRLLKLLISDPEAGHLLWVGAYRSNEIESAHPLLLALEDLTQAGQAVTTLTLGPLSQADTERFLADALHLETAAVAPLAELCFRRTQGNPFFLSQFLETLYGRGLLQVDPAQGQWIWQLSEIAGQSLTDNVVDFLSQNIRQLDPATAAVLQQAAVVGSAFDLASVADLVGATKAQTAQWLRPALIAEVVVPATASLDLETSFDFERDPAFNPRYRFGHDRIQQAAYGLLEPAAAIAAHYRLGQLRLAQRAELPADRPADDLLFDTVNHLNQAQTLLPVEQRRQLALLNLEAGCSAKQAAAYQAALSFLTTGLELLPETAWASDTLLIYRLYSEAAEAAYLAGDFAALAQFRQVVLAQVASPIQQVPVHRASINALVAQNRLLEAIAYTLEVLAALGEKLPAAPNSAQVLSQYLQARLSLWGKSAAALVALPLATDPQVLATLQLRISILSAAYYAQPALLPVLACSIVRTSVRHGIGPESPFAFAVLGLVQCSLGDEAGGYATGQISLELRQRITDRRLQNRAWHVFNAHLRFWREPYRHSQTSLREVYAEALDCGDLEYAAFGAMMSCAIAYHCGDPLEPLKQTMDSFSAAIRSLGQETSLYTHEINRQLVYNLTGDCDHPSRLVGIAYNEDTAVPLHQAAADTSNLFSYYCAKTVLHLVLGDYEAAAAAATLNRRYLSGAAATIYVPAYFTYDSLAQAQIFQSLPAAAQAPLRRRLRQNRQKVARWAALAPMNHQHHLTLIDAELARLEHQPATALEHYERAIALAREHGYLNDEALANELLGRFHQARGSLKTARAALMEARYLYDQWGAAAKVQQMNQAYSDQLREPAAAAPASSTTTLGSHSSLLDLEAVVRSSQALSNEIVLDKLLSQLLKTVLENAGAQRGLLLLEQAGQWRIEASGRADVGIEIAPQPVLLATDPALPLAPPPFSSAIVNYVRSTQESVVLSDAQTPGPFLQDPYISTAQPRSVLCTPLLNQGRLSGILYLENNLTTGAFTPERVELLQILSAQAAISIENSRLYAQLEDYSRTLEHKVAERTHELSQTLEVLRATQAELRFENELLKSADAPSQFDYQVGGSLPMDAPTYVVRSADRHFYRALRQGQFCYVLTSRQMGKSSLMVRMFQQLQQEGYRCAAIDMTRIGSETITPEQWYTGLAVELWQGFELFDQLNFKAWWRDRAELSPLQRLSQLIEQVLLPLAEDGSPGLVIFLDEIDSVLSLPFPVNDFFALIRACYNQRSLKPSYRQLSFALFGVATPSDLISDPQRTPFNLGQAIRLEGFKEHEAQPLLYGLSDRVSNPQTLLKALLSWTQGQPFLTQKLCQQIRASREPIAANQEAAWLAALVQNRIIQNWESQDEPEHLRTISDRILRSQQPAAQLLGLYRQILSQGAIALADSAAVEALLLSGLVVERSGQLEVRNRIYAAVFDHRWIDRCLAALPVEPA